MSLEEYRYLISPKQPYINDDLVKIILCSFGGKTHGVAVSDRLGYQCEADYIRLMRPKQNFTGNTNYVYYGDISCIILYIEGKTIPDRMDIDMHFDFCCFFDGHIQYFIGDEIIKSKSVAYAIRDNHNFYIEDAANVPYLITARPTIGANTDFYGVEIIIQ